MHRIGIALQIALLLGKTKTDPLPATATCGGSTTNCAKSWAVEVRRRVPRTPTDVSAADAANVFAVQLKRTGCSTEWKLDGATGNKGVFVRGLTFELSGRRRHGALDSKRKMGRRPSA